jgi:hypothetical protein
MSDLSPIQGKPPDDAQKQLVALFQKIEADQLDLLDAAGKRIIELTTALLGTLFAVVALGKDFPPSYLKSNAALQIALVLALAGYLLAMLMGMRTLQPRDYKLYRTNLTGMREELDKIIANKSGSLRVAGVAFWLASLLLALTIAVIVLSA